MREQDSCGFYGAVRSTVPKLSHSSLTQQVSKLEAPSNNGDERMSTNLDFRIWSPDSTIIANSHNCTFRPTKAGREIFYKIGCSVFIRSIPITRGISQMSVHFNHTKSDAMVHDS